ncbi:hypothetical protein NFI96_031388, partial [Prochilodus magdalenae]
MRNRTRGGPKCREEDPWGTGQRADPSAERKTHEEQDKGRTQVQRGRPMGNGTEGRPKCREEDPWGTGQRADPSAERKAHEEQDKGRTQVQRGRPMGYRTGGGPKRREEDPWGTGVWFSRISGEEVEVKVRPGDNAVLYSDCNWKHGFSMVWFRNSSHEHMVIHEEAHPRYSIVWSSFSKTSDLLVRNVSESDLGLYYCALQKTRPIRDKARACSGEDVCLYGNRTTRLSLHGKVTLVLVNTNVFIA